MFPMHVDRKMILVFELFVRYWLKIYSDIVERYKSVTEAWILSALFGHKLHYHPYWLELRRLLSSRNLNIELNSNFLKILSQIGKRETSL